MAEGQLQLVDGGAAGQPLYESSATQVHALGTEATDGAGRYFRYAQAGASNLVAGNVLTSPAQNTAHHTMTPVLTTYAGGIGATQIQFTLGASAVTANQYAGGFVTVDASTGIGQMLRISSHPAASSAATLVLNLADPVRVALASGSRLTLVPNAWKAVIQSPATTLTGPVVGCALYVLPATEYGWIGSGGPQPTLCGGTPIVGSLVVSPGDTAGEVVADPANAAVDCVGVMMVTAADGEVDPVLWYRR